MSRYHEDAGYSSPTTSSLISNVTTAYAKKVDREGTERDIRAGIGAKFSRLFVRIGLETAHTTFMGGCAMFLFAFIFQCRFVSVAHVGQSDL